MALRELFSKFEVSIKGVEALKSANAQLDKSKTESEENIKGLSRLGKVWTAVKDKVKSWIAALRNGVTGLLNYKSAANEAEEETTLWSSALIKIATVISGLGTAVLVAGLLKYVEGVTEAVDATGKLATTTGLAVESVQRWGHVTTTAGGNNEQFAASVKTLTNNLLAVARGSKEAQENFEEIGIDTATLANRELEDVLLDVSVGLANVTDKNTQLGLAQKLLGESSLKLLPGFKNSREEMLANLKSMDRLAGVYSEDFVRSAEATNDELHFMRNQFSVLRSVVVQAILPVFRGVVSVTTRITASFREFLTETRAVDRWLRVGAIGGFARMLSLIAANWHVIVRAVASFIRSVAPIARIIARFLIWAGILDEIIVFLQGGDGYLRDWIDKLFEIGTADKVLKNIHALWDIVVSGLRTGAEVIGWLWDDFKGLMISIESGGKPWEEWGGVVGRVLGGVINLLKDAVKLIDKVTGISDVLKGVGGVLFDAEDERLNREAIERARGNARNAKAPGGLSTPRAAGGGRSVWYVDNSTHSVSLTGPQTPETVRTAAREARGMRSSNKSRANALVRDDK